MLVFSPVGHPVAFFSEKLSEAKEKILHIRQGVICDGTSSMLLEALSYFKEFVLSSDPSFKASQQPEEVEIQAWKVD